jgi:type II secretory pathway component PulM
MRLTARERWVLAGTVSIVLLLLGYALVVAPLRSGSVRLQEALRVEREGYQRALAVHRQIVEIKGSASAGSWEQSVRRAALRQGIREGAIAARPMGSSTLELVLTGLRWQQTAELLQELGGAIPIRRAQLRRAGKDSIDLSVQVPAQPGP